MATIPTGTPDASRRGCQGDESTRGHTSRVFLIHPRMGDSVIEGSTNFACPICETHRLNDYIVVGRGSAPGGVKNFPVLRCRRHGVEFADAPPLPVSDDDRRASLDCLYGTSMEPEFRYVDFMDRVEAVVGRQPGGLLHDVGCGNGQLLFEARRRGWRVQGNDVVSVVRSHIERNGIRCLIGNLSELDLEPESCDVVTSFCVLPHHLTNPTQDMQAVERILKPGGWFVLQFPANGLFRRVGKLVYRMYWPWRPSAFSRFILANLYEPGGHQFAYTHRNLAEYLRACGFGEVAFAPYYPALRFTLARFHARPLWFRAGAFLAVALLRLAAQTFRLPNHAIAYARKAS